MRHLVWIGVTLVLFMLSDFVCGVYEVDLMPQWATWAAGVLAGFITSTFGAPARD